MNGSQRKESMIFSVRTPSCPTHALTEVCLPVMITGRFF